tara:strand:- start:544 stop:741 length:198 start_codon:yes stop_codon:yes gene_type:complete
MPKHPASAKKHAASKPPKAGIGKCKPMQSETNRMIKIVHELYGYDPESAKSLVETIRAKERERTA